MPSVPVSVDELTLADGELFHDKKGRAKPLPVALAPLADSHGHLTSFRAHEASIALCRAAIAGVRLLVVPVDPTDDVADVPAFLAWLDQITRRARERVEECAEHGLVPPDFTGWDVPDLVDNIRLVAGAHPYGAERLDGAALSRLDALLNDPRCVGVGEIGLDYGPYSQVPRDAQLAAFRQQLRIARSRNLPVELHIRDAADDAGCAAHADAVRVLQEEGVPQAGCDLHCFTQGPEVMRPFVELGCYVAFGGAATFKRSDDIRAAAVECPTDLILCETDCPYMAPVPLRGQESEPAMVAFSAACVASVRSIAGVCPEKDTYQALWRNANRLIGQAC